MCGGRGVRGWGVIRAHPTRSNSVTWDCPQLPASALVPPIHVARNPNPDPNASARPAVPHPHPTPPVGTRRRRRHCSGSNSFYRDMYSFSVSLYLVTSPPPFPVRSTPSSCARATPVCAPASWTTRSRCAACRTPTWPSASASCRTARGCRGWAASGTPTRWAGRGVRAVGERARV